MVDSSSHGAHGTQPFDSSASLSLPGSRSNPIDLSSPTSATPPAPRREHINSSRASFNSTRFGTSSAFEPTTASYIEGVTRPRSTTQGRFRYLSSNTFAPRYGPRSLPSASSRPHSLSSPSPVAARSTSNLPRDTQPGAYLSQHGRAGSQTMNSTLNPRGVRSPWEPPSWPDPVLPPPPRTFNELLPSTPSTSAYQAETTAEVRRAAWQPDEDVTACTRCSREFGLLIRRHHCRKCGLVVCAVCSTHRISIPRKYIAQPAEYDTEGELENGDDLQTVRVCDPCVPDPNWGPPPQQHYSPSFPRSPLLPPPIPPRMLHRMAAEPIRRPVPVPFEQPAAGPSQFEGLLPSSRSPSRPQQPPNNPARHYHRMATYIASEKDVRSQNDELQECVICLEEFEVGEDLALLECFCKFHKNCIVEWWEKDAAGSCPTHKLRE